MEKKIITVTEYNVTIRMYEHLLWMFENALDCIYYGEGKAQWMERTQEYMSESDAKKLWREAWYFMAEDKQPDLDVLGKIALTK